MSALKKEWYDNPTTYETIGRSEVILEIGPIKITSTQFFFNGESINDVNDVYKLMLLVLNGGIQLNREWIPCSQPPKTQDTVAVRWKGPMNRYHYMLSSYFNGHWYDYRESYRIVIDDYKAAEWFVLPKTYSSVGN